MKDWTLEECQRIAKSFQKCPLVASVPSFQKGLIDVRKRLSQDPTMTPQQWLADTKRVFTDAISHWGKQSPVSGIAEYLNKKLDKEIRQLERKNLRNYEAHLIELCKRLEAVARKPPSIYQVVCEKETHTADSDDFTVARLLSLREKLDKLVNEGKQEEVTKIVREYENQYGQTIDLSELGRQTLLELEKLV